MSEVRTSVIVATHQRREFVLETVEALASQRDIDPRAYEVIVSADACEDGTAAAVRAASSHWPVHVTVVEHESRNASRTRNIGAQHATGAWLVFLDDDIRPHPGFLAAHAAARRDGFVNLGYAKPVITMPGDRWHREVWRWWEDVFHRGIGEPGHRFRFTDFLSGNFSMSASLFSTTGGFDQGFSTAWEDHELGLRLLRSGVRFAYFPDAVGDHRFGMDLPRALRRRRQEGRATVEFGRVHPELRSIVFEAVTMGWLARSGRTAMRLAANHSKVADLIAAQCIAVATAPSVVAEAWRLRAARFALDLVYWQGVLDELGTLRRFWGWLADAPLPPRVSPDAPTVELMDIEALDPDTLMSDAHPGSDFAGLLVSYDGAPLLSIRPDPAAEPLRALHVVALAQRECHARFVARRVPPQSDMQGWAG